MTELTKKEQQAIETYRVTLSQRKAADQMGISRWAFRNLYDRAQAKLNNSPVGYKTTKINTDANGAVTSRTHKLAPETTEDAREGTIVRRSTLYGADGNVTGEWVIRKPVPEVVNHVDSFVEAFKERLTNLPDSQQSVADISTQQDKMCLFNIVDDHMNMRAFFEETGEDWDIEKAYALYIDRFSKLVENSPDADIAVLFNIGDQFHNNDHMNVTPASKHALETDVPFATAARIIIKLNRARVEILRRKYGTVIVKGVRGNHDEDAMVLLYEGLDIAYESDPNVTVEYDQKNMHVMQFGVNMIVHDHGDKGKPEVIAGAAAAEFPEVFGSTNARFIHTGHIHHDNEKDTWGGFLWRSHRTLSARDKYSASHKYHSPRSIKSYLYDASEGEVAMTKVNVI